MVDRDKVQKVAKKMSVQNELSSHGFFCGQDLEVLIDFCEEGRDGLLQDQGLLVSEVYNEVSLNAERGKARSYLDLGSDEQDREPVPLLPTQVGVESPQTPAVKAPEPMDHRITGGGASFELFEDRFIDGSEFSREAQPVEALSPEQGRFVDCADQDRVTLLVDFNLNPVERHEHLFLDNAFPSRGVLHCG